MIKSRIVGVKLPESGTGAAVVVAVAAGVAVAVGEGVGEVLGLAVGEADGVDSKDGPSAAWTIKVRLNVLNMPLASRQVIVIL